MLRFRFLGFPVEVQPFFWLTMAMFGGGFSATSAEDWRDVMLWVTAAFASVLIHELGHALTMRRYGEGAVRIVLYAFGGVAMSQSLARTRGRQIAISAAGPGLEIGAALLVHLVARAFGIESEWLRAWVTFFVGVSLFWGVFNLIPIVPMDGGRILEAALGPARIRTTLTISMVLAIAAGAALFLLFGSLFGAIFMGMMALSNWQQLNQGRSAPWTRVS